MSELSENIETNIQRVEVDWLTFTVKQSEDRAWLRDIAHAIFTEEAEIGNRKRYFAWMGYQGLQTNYVRWGERPDGSILVLISDHAAAYWRHLRGKIGRATRLDAAVDFYVEPEYNTALAESLYETCDRAWQGDRVYSIIKGSDGGSTFYAGSRKAGKVLRVYNKSVQSGHPQDCPQVWRAELEVKGKKAHNVWAQLRSQAHPETLLCYLVRSQLVSWYLPLNLECGKILMNATQSKLLSVEGGKTLTWLKQQVSPAIARLIDLGEVEAVEHALGYRLISFGGS